MRILTLLLATVLAFPVAAHGPASREGEPATITVTGSAMASVSPDRVSIRFGVDTQEKTSSLALQANSDLMDAVIRAVTKTGIEKDEIRTSQFNIQPVYENQLDRQTGVRTQVLSGYRVSNVLEVRTDKLDESAAIIDAAVGSGLNRVDNVSFYLSAKALTDLKDGLIAEAMNDARSRADKALGALSQEIVGVRQVNLSDFSNPMQRVASMNRMEMASSAPTQLFAGDQEVRTAVSVVFEIAARAATQGE